MPKGKNWLYFTFVNLGFVAQVVAMYYFSSIKQIRDNWQKYRCNPLYMPLSNNIMTDFTYCVQNIQSSYMGYLLQPLTYATNLLGSMGSELTGSLNVIRNVVSTIRNLITSTVESVFGVFLNLVIEFQKITIGIKDLVGKIVGMMVTMMYIMDGSGKTMQSMWNGPPGQMVKSLQGKCFHPDILITLKNGNVVAIKDLNLGDILDSGSRVTAVMKIDNINNPEPLYKIGDIYVTGSHMILNGLQFIPVKEHPEAQPQNAVKSSYYSCLITHDHKIKIGKYMFWDWEDYIIKFGK